MENMGVL